MKYYVAAWMVLLAVGAAHAASSNPCIMCEEFVKCVTAGCRGIEGTMTGEECGQKAEQRAQGCILDANKRVGPNNFTSTMNSKLISMAHSIGLHYWAVGEELTLGQCAGDLCCTGCDSSSCLDTEWQDAALLPGYQSKQKKTCQCGGGCSAIYEYRCAAGYWGAASDNYPPTGCTQCPAPGTSAPGSTTRESCYTRSGSDDTGSFTFSENCYYK